MTRIVWTMLLLGVLSLWSLPAQEEADGCRRAFDGIKTSMHTVLGNAQEGSCLNPFNIDLQGLRSTLLEKANVALDNGEWFEVVDFDVQSCPDREGNVELSFVVTAVSGTMSKQKFLKIAMPKAVPYMVSDEDLAVVPNMCMAQVQWYLQEEDNPHADWNPAYAGYQYWVDLLKYRGELDSSIIKGGAFLFSNDDDFTLDILERIEEAESSD